MASLPEAKTADFLRQDYGKSCQHEERYVLEGGLTEGSSVEWRMFLSVSPANENVEKKMIPSSSGDQFNQSCFCFE